MRIAVDIDDTLNIVDRVGRAGAYIASRKLPFKLVDENTNFLVKTYDWQMDDVLKFIREGGITAFTDAEARVGAKEALSAFRAEGHEIVILTSRTKEWFVNPEKVSKDWLEKRRIPYDDIVPEIFEKGAYCLEHGIDVLIEDNVDVCLKAQELGIYAVLAVGKHNVARAHEITYGGANWKQLYAQVERILQIGTFERHAAQLDGGGTHFAALLPRGDLIANARALEKSAAERGLLCRFRLTPLEKNLDAALEGAGFPLVRTGECLVLDKIPPFPRGGSFHVTSELEEGWLKEFYALGKADYDEAVRFSAIRGERTFFTLFEGGRTVALGLSVREGETVGVYCLRVHPDYRRRGYGTALLERILAEARKAGAKRAYAHIRAANYPAVELVKSLGFVRAYDYWYREK